MRRKNCSRLSRGITLVELLVVMVLIAIGMSATFAGYRRFDRVQKVRQAALTLKNNLRLAQTKAIAVDHPVTCGTLSSINVVFGSDSYTLNYNCGSNVPFVEVFWPEVITVTSNPGIINFELLTGEVLGGATVILSYDSISFTVSVSDKGVIDCVGGSGLKCY